jgi:hypothetical protein
MDEQKYKRFPGNVPGAFYVEDDICMNCRAPQVAAPDLMDFDEEARSCYFKKQPSTLEEYEQAIQAVWVSCCDSIHYSTDDPVVLQQINEVKGREHQIQRSVKFQCRSNTPLLEPDIEESKRKPWWRFW